MTLPARFKFRKHLFLTLILVIFIFILIGAILGINYYSNTRGPDLENAQILSFESERLANFPEVAESGFLDTINPIIVDLNSKTLSRDEKYELLEELWEYTIIYYSEINNPELYKFQLALNEFIIRNYPKKTILTTIQSVMIQTALRIHSRKKY